MFCQCSYTMYLTAIQSCFMQAPPYKLDMPSSCSSATSLILMMSLLAASSHGTSDDISFRAARRDSNLPTAALFQAAYARLLRLPPTFWQRLQNSCLTSSRICERRLQACSMIKCFCCFFSWSSRGPASNNLALVLKQRPSFDAFFDGPAINGGHTASCRTERRKGNQTRWSPRTAALKTSATTPFSI